MRRHEWPVRRCAAAASAIVALMLGASAAAARQPTSAALLFTYRPHAGMEDEFRLAYETHLDWHRAHADSLIWYGWEVLTGERPGYFIDGTFGRPFRAFDRRVDPAGDASDFAAGAGRLADAVSRSAWVLRNDLGTSTALEDGNPTGLLEVLHYNVRPGMERDFETILRAMQSGPQTLPPYTWYQLVSGGAHPGYLLVIHRNGLSGWDSMRMDVASVIGAWPDERSRGALLGSLRETVVSMVSETWRFLPRSGLIPARIPPSR